MTPACRPSRVGCSTLQRSFALVRSTRRSRARSISRERTTVDASACSVRGSYAAAAPTLNSRRGRGAVGSRESPALEWTAATPATGRFNVEPTISCVPEGALRSRIRRSIGESHEVRNVQVTCGPAPYRLTAGIQEPNPFGDLNPLLNAEQVVEHQPMRRSHVAIRLGRHHPNRSVRRHADTLCGLAKFDSSEFLAGHVAAVLQTSRPR